MAKPQLPNWRDIRARSRSILQWKALPGWLVIAIGALRWLFKTWAEVEFAWHKVEPVTRFVLKLVWSPIGLLVIGLGWLTALLLRPVDIKQLDDDAFVPPKINIFDGRLLTIVVTNTGTKTMTFQAMARIEAASFDFDLRHPVQLSWLDGQGNFAELQPHQGARVLVAEYEHGDEDGDKRYGYLYMRGAVGAADIASWYLTDSRPEVVLRLQIAVISPDAPTVARWDATLQVEASVKTKVITAQILEPTAQDVEV